MEGTEFRGQPWKTLFMDLLETNIKGQIIQDGRNFLKGAISCHNISLGEGSLGSKIPHTGDTNSVDRCV